jgi:hypothetical protein
LFRSKNPERHPTDIQVTLSGNGLQAISPWMAFTEPNAIVQRHDRPIKRAGGRSGCAFEVASYDTQLGRIGDALVVLLNHFHPRTPLTEEETAAINDLQDMLERIADVKGTNARHCAHLLITSRRRS